MPGDLLSFQQVTWHILVLTFFCLVSVWARRPLGISEAQPIGLMLALATLGNLVMLEPLGFPFVGSEWLQWWL